MKFKSPTMNTALSQNQNITKANAVLKLIYDPGALFKEIFPAFSSSFKMESVHVFKCVLSCRCVDFPVLREFLLFD